MINPVFKTLIPVSRLQSVPHIVLQKLHLWVFFIAHDFVSAFVYVFLCICHCWSLLDVFGLWSLQTSLISSSHADPSPFLLISLTSKIYVMSLSLNLLNRLENQLLLTNLKGLCKTKCYLIFGENVLMQFIYFCKLL